VSSVVITTRRRKSGPRYVVRYRLGGRAYPVIHAGSFPTLRAAKIRRDFIAGEIAAGRNPAGALGALVALAAPVAPVATVNRWSERFIASRIDVDANTTKNYRTALRKAGETFGQRDPATITASEIAEWVAALTTDYKASTVRLYLLSFRLLLDYAGVEPNPARDPRVRKPKNVREEPTPPSANEVEAILAAVGPKWRLLLIMIEQGALRLGEAVTLRWKDVDASNLRLRLPRSATKRDRARWVYLPAWLIDAIEATCPREDRTPERRVFAGITEASAYQAMSRACTAAGVAHFHPHDLRHRRITIWHQSGVPARELAERAGHARPSMSLDVYAHVMPPDELEHQVLVDLISE
jgi:integrase